jgi:hypothetical protein
MAINMTFVDYQTIVPADWLNNVNAFVNGGSAAPIQSIAALRALNNTPYVLVSTQGYYAAGDGGQSTYIKAAGDHSSSDNGGTIIVSVDGTRWYLAQSTPASIRQWGAKLDGVTDDYNAFVNSGGGCFVPRGSSIYLSQNVVPFAFTSDGTVTFTGPGWCSILNIPNGNIPRNYYLATWFRSDDDPTVDLYGSADGINFGRINSGPLRAWNFGSIAFRDPSLFYNDGYFYIGVTSCAPGDHDMIIYRSPDLVEWTQFTCTLGPTAVCSNTTPAPGGSTPAQNIWAPTPFKIGTDIYVQVSIQYAPNEIDINGTSIPVLQQYYSKCLDLDNMIFDVPVLFNKSTAHCTIDGKLYVVNGQYQLIVKNDYDKHIEIWTSSTFNGAYTQTQDLTFSGQSEAPALVVENYIDQTTLQPMQKYRLYSDNYSQWTYEYRESLDFSTWTAPALVNTKYSLRHGDVLNLVNLDDPIGAMAIADRANAAFGSPDSTNVFRNVVHLSPGVNTIEPQDETLYYVSGTDQAQFNISTIAGKSFYLGILSNAPNCWISLPTQQYFIPANGAYEILGGGRTNNTIFRVSRTEADSQQYVIESLRYDNSQALILGAQPGWPNINQSGISWWPSFGDCYTTDGTYTSTTTIFDLPGDIPDGHYFHLCVQSLSGSAGTIIIKASGAHMAIGNDITISPSTMGDNVYTLKKIGGLWRWVS